MVLYNRIWFAAGSSGDIVALGVNAGKPWVNVFTRSGAEAPYTRYGYHLNEKRWAFESLPADSGVIEKMLETVPDLQSDMF